MPAPPCVPAPPGMEKFFFRAPCVPAPPGMEKRIFRASRLVRAPKVHRESEAKKKICASRLVPAPKVHRKSREHFFLRFALRDRIFFSLRASCRKVFFLCAALCTRSPRQLLTSNGNGKNLFFVSRMVQALSTALTNASYKKNKRSTFFFALRACVCVFCSLLQMRTAKRE